jgi:hypothetical protein
MSGLIKFKFGFENHLKICFEKLEKEKEMNFFSSRAASYRSPMLGLQRRPTFPAPAPASGFSGPSPSRGQPAHFARAAFFRTEPLTSRSRLSASPSPFLLLPPALSKNGNRRLPLSSDSIDRIHLRILPFPCFRVPSGYKNGASARFRPHPILLEQPKLPSAATVSTTASTVRHRKHAAVFVHPVPSFLSEVSSPCSKLPPGVSPSLNGARSRVFACSDDGAAAGSSPTAGVRPERRRFFPDPIWTLRFESNDLD